MLFNNDINKRGLFNLKYLNKLMLLNFKILSLLLLNKRRWFIIRLEQWVIQKNGRAKRRLITRGRWDVIERVRSLADIEQSLNIDRVGN